MTTYMTDTFPSDYDLDQPWSCTIGRCEDEMDARALVVYLQENGDEWVLVLREDLIGTIRPRGPQVGRAIWSCRSGASRADRIEGVAVMRRQLKGTL